MKPSTLRVLLAGTKHTCEKASELKFSSPVTLLPFPLMETKLITDTPFPKKKYEWAVFTSPAAAEHFFSINAKPVFKFIAAVGPSTAESIQKFGLTVDFTPTEFNSICLADELSAGLKEKSTLIFPCSKLADNSLENIIRSKGHLLDRVNLYEPVEFPFQELPEFDAIAFFSSSAVETFFNNFGESALKGKKIAAIGKKAAASVEGRFKQAALVPKNSTALETIKVLL